MSKFEDFHNYRTTQDGIYDKFRAAQADIPTKGVEVDPGTELQSAFLIAWRFPGQVAADIGGYSARLNRAVPSVIYGAHNAHVTLSDYALTKGKVINPERREAAETLAGLAAAVRSGIDVAGGVRALRDARVTLADTMHNGKTGVIAGQANQTLFDVRQSVLASARDDGYELKGAWGAHSTISRVRQAYGAGSSAVARLVDVLGEAPRFGVVKPASLDVGYFVAGPQGFEINVFERFDV